MKTLAILAHQPDHQNQIKYDACCQHNPIDNCQCYRDISMLLQSCCRSPRPTLCANFTCQAASWLACVLALIAFITINVGAIICHVIRSGDDTGREGGRKSGARVRIRLQIARVRIGGVCACVRALRCGAPATARNFDCIIQCDSRTANSQLR